MATLSSIEKRKLERLLGMGGGYVLNFSDRTFSMFFEEHTGLDIDDRRYRGSGTSKANRMRGFWAVEPDHVVAKVLLAMIEHATEYECVPADMDDALFADVHRIIARLNQNPSSPVPRWTPSPRASTNWTSKQQRNTFGPRSSRTSQPRPWIACTCFR